MKALNVDARKIFALKAISPGMSKHLGRAIVLRPNWDTIRLVTMAVGLGLIAAVGAEVRIRSRIQRVSRYELSIRQTKTKLVAALIT